MLALNFYNSLFYCLDLFCEMFSHIMIKLFVLILCSLFFSFVVSDCRENILLNELCCGQQIYNPETHFCCGSLLNLIPFPPL